MHNVLLVHPELRISVEYMADIFNFQWSSSIIVFLVHDSSMITSSIKINSIIYAIYHSIRSQRMHGVYVRLDILAGTVLQEANFWDKNTPM